VAQSLRCVTVTDFPVPGQNPGGDSGQQPGPPSYLPPPSFGPHPPPPPPFQGGAGGGYAPPPPPGYTPYQGGYATTLLHRVDGLSKAIVVLLGCASVASLLLWLVIATSQDELVDSIGSGQFGGPLGAIVALSGIQGLLSLATGIVTMVWMFRSTKNVCALGRSTGTWTPGWAIGGWFCPPCLFVIPWLHMKELWKATEPRTSGGMWQAGSASPIVTIWWVLYGLAPIGLTAANVGSQQAGIFGTSDNLSEAYSGAAVSQGLSTFVSLAAAVSFSMVVRGITTRQKALVS
jgi:Domain of unknown function (DUF4328)